MANRVLTVSECTSYLKRLLEQDPVLQGARVSGEVSNLTYHRSGHLYFTLKDSEAQIACVMFQSDVIRAPKIEAGDSIIVTGFVTVYAPRGNYQLRVTRIEKQQGQGDLFQQFQALKERLAAEGLFDPRLKKPLPRFPKHLAIVTSPTGAALQDMLRTLQRRWPVAKVTVIPAQVQGEGGVPSILRGLARAQDTGADLILLARGGGSIEDLWNFNEEAVARAIRASKLPVITGVGHETDVTIADFAADLRASTPTAAAEHAVPDRQDLLDRLDGADAQVKRSLRYFIDFKRQMIDEYSLRVEQAIRQQIQQRRHKIDLLESQLRGMDQTTLLRRGYTLTLKNGEILRSVSQLQPGDQVETVFADGKIRSDITDFPTQLNPDE